MSYISKYCIIRNNEVIINNEVYYSQNKNIPFVDFIKGLYKHTAMNYSKFFKMDCLSKLGIVTSELLLKETDISKNYLAEEIGIVIENTNSSIQTDIEFYNTIKDENNFFPSPALFVYTLSNIMIGEICIKNKIQGENGLFVFDSFNPEFLFNYINNLFNDKKIKICISGYIDCSDNEFVNNESKYEAVLFLIEKEIVKENYIIFEPENISKIYQNNI